MRNAGLEETQAGIKIARRNINNLRYADDTTVMAESEEELKSLLMKVQFSSVQLLSCVQLFAAGVQPQWSREFEGEMASAIRKQQLI